jgi:hypothetical protein
VKIHAVCTTLHHSRESHELGALIDDRDVRPCELVSNNFNPIVWRLVVNTWTKTGDDSNLMRLCARSHGEFQGELLGELLERLMLIQTNTTNHVIVLQAGSRSS